MALLTPTITAQKKSKKEKKAEHKAMLEKQTRKLVDSKTFQFCVSQMLPANGSVRVLTTDYNVVLQNDTVNSYLPYFGRAYFVQYGSGESPMTFKTPITDYFAQTDKRDGYLIRFSAKNKSDKINFTFKISTNGSSTLSVTSTNRQSISYYGKLEGVGKE